MFDGLNKPWSLSFIDENNISFNCSEQYLMYHKCKLFDPNNIQMLQQILDKKLPLLKKLTNVQGKVARFYPTK